ncbi:hypothetical protein J7K42_01405 [bacterium]|nr:hypothetical protein [bacterium]
MTKKIAFLLSVLILSFAAGVFIFAWTEPSASPPSGNVSAPVNVGDTEQVKSGKLGIATDGIDASYGLTVGNSTNLLGVKAAGNSYFEKDLTVAGKLTVSTIDPIYEIDGRQYVTYVADFVGGVRTETSGLVDLQTLEQRSQTNSNDQNSRFQTVIDFDNLEKGSDLWLFWQTSNKNIDDLVVLLTPEFDGEVWYQKDGNKLIIYGPKKGEVSYRLTLPRQDYKNWGNLNK